eukprot:CAMPEP_0168318106 /NCGR_PEP_ID=MMETSP0213-20121227/279_1 /TAXON_ID=151035 /ORGANISM="Euplotes harpa, Strain FSP1.4" /LENGTH=137 /DNA_ID=CAMNT_0008319105 /DNA_START=16 /DNA_END=425 /DNA_ORIENTATION=+
MKLWSAVVLIALITLASGSQVLIPRDSEEILSHLTNNNFNVYLLLFVDQSARDSDIRDLNQDLEGKLGTIVTSNSDIFFSKIDVSNPRLMKVVNEIGVTTTPAVLLMVHGKGVWLKGKNTYLMSERIKDFLPVFKQS